MSDVKTELVIYTDGGYRQVENVHCAGAGIWVEGEEIGTVIPCGRDEAGASTSNNVAELAALDYALHLAKTHPAKKVIIRSDSQYALKAIGEWAAKWEKNGWHKSSGGLIANYELVKSAYETWKVLKAINRVSLEWVKGHSSNVGNDNADKLATMGCINAYNSPELGIGRPETVRLDECLTTTKQGRIIPLPVTKTKKKEESDTETTPQGKVIPANPFVAFQFIMGLTHENDQLDDGRTFYFNTTFPSKTKADMDLDADSRMSKAKKDYAKVCLCGVVDPDTVESIVITRTPMEAITKIKLMQDKISPGKVSFPYLINWNEIRGVKKWKHLHTELDEIKAEHFNVVTPNKLQLSYFLQTPAISMQAWERGQHMLQLIEMFTDGKLESTDVTEYFVPGKKREIPLEIREMPLWRIPADDGREYLFTGGKDCPDKNALNKIIKTRPEARIHILRSGVTKGSLRYHMLITSDDDVGIYGSPAGNIKLY